MTKPELEPLVKDEAPTGVALTDYDRLHFITYLRLLPVCCSRGSAGCWKADSKPFEPMTMLSTPHA